MSDTHIQHEGVQIIMFFLLRKDNRLNKRAIWKKEWRVLEN